MTHRAEAGPQMALADSFFFIAHDGRAGKRRLHPRAVSTGLAAALLGELFFWQAIDIHDGSLYVISRGAPGDALAHKVLAQLMSQPQHRDLRIWLAYLSEIALDEVAARMTLTRLVRPVEQRKLIGTRTVHLPVDANIAAWQAIRLERLLNTYAPMSQADGLLAGLVFATGLTWHVLWDNTSAANGSAYLPRVVSSLHPALRELVAHTEAAVGQTVLAPR